MSAVVVELNSDCWIAFHAPGKQPVEELKMRAAQTLKTSFAYEDDEVEAITSDPLFQENARKKYYDAKRTFDHRRKIPRTVKIEFNRPGTRTKRGNPVEAG